MKKAMDKDLSNPKTLELITQAHSDSESVNKRANSFNSDHNVDQKTPKTKQQKKALINIKPLSNAANYVGPLTPQDGNYLTVRNNTLRSISEEEQSASMASPYTVDERMNKVHTINGESIINTKFLSSRSHGRTNSLPQNESELEQFNKMLGCVNSKVPNQRSSNNS